MAGAATGVGFVYTTGEAIAAGGEVALQALEQRGKSIGLTPKEQEEFSRSYGWMGECALAVATTKMPKGATTTKIAPKTNLNLNNSNQGLYHPHEVRQHLENKYPGQVSSSTVPAANAKNVKLAGQRHPETGIVFDQRGYPIFDDVAKFDTKISREVSNMKNDKMHMRAATRELREQINSTAVAFKKKM